MISHKHKCVFVHIPKTGGTSIEEALPNIGSKWPAHRDITALLNSVTDDRYDINNYFKFSFVRNPWSRFVSLFNYFKSPRRGRRRLHRECFGRYTQDENKKFKKFANSFNRGKPMVAYGVWDVHYKEQWRFIYDNDQQAVDYIGRFETLQDSFNVALDNIGLQHRQLPHLRKTKHKHYTEYYDDETRQIVAEKYAKDIEYFGYKFGE